MILIVTQTFAPVNGGMEALMKGMAEALHAAGRGVSVLADGRGGEEERVHDADCPYAVARFGGLKPLRRRRKARALRALIEAGHVEGVFCDSWKSAELVVRRLPGRPVPVACLAHGNDVLVPARRWLRRRRVGRALASSHRVVANSRFTGGLVEGFAVAHERVLVMHPGVDRPPREPVPEADADATAARPVLLTLGRIEPRKGHEQVLRSMPALVAQHPGLHYVIAGDGPGRGALEALARDLGLQSRVRFAGRVSEAEKWALLHAATLFVMPTRTRVDPGSVEGFGIVFIEAGYAGLPSVAGDSGGVADAILDGETGRLCDGDDLNAVRETLAACLADPAGMEAMGTAARERAERDFPWSAAIERYLSALD